MNKQSKYKICRRLGSGVYEKCQTQKFALSESKKNDQKKKGRRKQVTDYGKQLIEKQKLRFTYDLKEGQLVKYVNNVMAQKGINIYEKLFQDIESRLDNTVFRLGLAETRAKATQIVNHGHITVNGKKLNIPSYKVSVGETVGIRIQSVGKVLFADLSDRMKDSTIPTWLSFDISKNEGQVLGLPKMSDGEIFDLRSVFEFYSR